MLAEVQCRFTHRSVKVLKQAKGHGSHSENRECAQEGLIRSLCIRITKQRQLVSLVVPSLG